MIRPTLGISCIVLATCGIAAIGAGAQPPRIEPGAPFGPLAAMTIDVAAAKTVRPRPRASFNPPVVRVRGDRATLPDRAIVRSTHAEFATASGLLALDVTRVRRSSADGRQAGLARDRSVIWSMDVGYELQVGQDDRLRLTATAGGEKRKPRIALADGRASGTSTRAIGLGWRRGDGLQLDAGWFRIAPSRSLAAIDRTISLAAGSPIAECGYRAEASTPLALPDGRPARLGVRFAAASVDQKDRLALGVTDAGDIRTALFLGIRFR